MNKSKFFTAVITVVISVAILFVIINIIFNQNNKVNQGKFRVSDAILTSIVKLEDKSGKEATWQFDISQNNKVSMLIQSNEKVNIKKAYLNKIKVSSSNDVSIYIEQEKYNINYKYENIKNKNVDIYAEKREDGNYLIEFNINNEDVISNYTIPAEIKEIRYDGTILNIAKISISKIKFDIKYNLVLIEENGQVNTCKIKLNMPEEKLINEGLSLQKLNTSEFNFKVDY